MDLNSANERRNVYSCPADKINRDYKALHLALCMSPLTREIQPSNCTYWFEDIGDMLEFVQVARVPFAESLQVSPLFHLSVRIV
jgi:hypothetical protein